MPNNFHPLIKDCGIYALRRTDPEGRCTWNCHVLHESVWKGKKKGREEKEERSCQLFRHGAGYCAVNKISSAHVTITLVVNGSTGWFYIYIYIFRKFERKLPSISVEIGFEGKRNDPGKTCFMGELEKKIIRPFFVHLYTNCNTKDLWIKSLPRLKYLVCSLQIVTINKIYDQISKYN